jgi:hypothetical protein
MSFVNSRPQLWDDKEEQRKSDSHGYQFSNIGNTACIEFTPCYVSNGVHSDQTYALRI